MKLELTKPIVFFDLETTGLQIGSDKIVEIGMLKVFPEVNGESQTEAITYRINPGVPIPNEVSVLHGIYDKDVADKPKFAQLAPQIYAFLKDCDLAGYNLHKFDVPMLVEEFLRAGIELDLSQVRIIDVQNIFHKLESRTLVGAYRFYCDKELARPFATQRAVETIVEILEAQLSLYQDVKKEDENGSESMPIQNDVTTLSKFSIIDRNVDFAGHIIFDENDKEVFNFGKYKGCEVESTFRKDPAFYDWMMRAEFPLYTKKIITNIRMRAVSHRFTNR